MCPSIKGLIWTNIRESLPDGRGSEYAKTPTDKTAIQRQIDATDREIDKLVYELYELTDDEIRIVEEATSRKP